MKLGYNDFPVTGVQIVHKIYEAPQNGKMYVRGKGKWVELLEATNSLYYSKQQIDDIVNNIVKYDDSYIQEQLKNKVDKDSVYSKEQVNQLLQEIPTYDDSSLLEELENKIDSSQVYNKEESDDRYVLKGTVLENETDPTVPDWAKTPNKPNYTAEEVGAISLSMLDSLGAGVQYTTEEEYDNLETIQEDKFYVCLENEEVSKLYLGKFLIAKKSLNPQSNGFPYVLPITF